MSKAHKKKRKRKNAHPVLRAFLIVLALILAACLALGGVLLIAPLTETADAPPVPGSADWMARLDDDLPLSELVLPGTHDSAAQYCALAFFTKCQALSVREQLEAGFRYLDLRLAMNERSDGFILTHGDYACRTSPFGGTLSFDSVLAACCAFLDAHPGETVLLAVRQETGGHSVRDCQLLLDAYIRENPQYWLAADTIPTLGEARGKLVILRRWEDEVGLREEAGIPFRWRDQGGFEDTSLNAASEDMGSFTLRVQDRWEYDTEPKWDAFLAGMRGAEEGAVSLSFLSTKGQTRYGHPYEYANELNARLLESGDAELTGWIVVDFGDAAIAEKIYRQNQAR